MTEISGTVTGTAMADRVVQVRGAYRTFERDTAPVRALRGADLDVARG